VSTVAALVERFLAHVRAAVVGGRNSPGTLLYYEYQLRHLLRATDAAGKPVRDRDPATLELADLTGLPATPHCSACIRRLFRWAKMPNPLADVPVPLTGMRTRVLDRQELRRLRHSCHFELRRFVWFLSQTGARPGELRQLTWEQVSEIERVIRLSKFKARDRRKDGVRVRLIPMSKAAARVLAYWRRKRYPLPSDHVFVNDHCEPWSCATLRAAMHRACRRARLHRDGEPVVCYTLRHTFATQAVARGIQETLLADILGHTTLSTTRRYLHRRPADLVAGIDRVMGSGGGGAKLGTSART